MRECEGARKPGAWQCTTCGRHIPRHIEVCRCGSERKRLEALGYEFEGAPEVASKPLSRPRRQSTGLAGTLVGYQLDTDLGDGTRLALKMLLAIAVVGVAVALVVFTHTEPLPIRDNIQILTNLDSFTRQQPDSGNTIPTFLTSAGRLGILAATGVPGDPVRSIQESDLQQGFCSQSMARQVRHEYPGFYDKWPDDQLEKVFLEKFPQYADRLCVLSVRFDATAADVIKYELKPRSLLAHAFLWLRTLVLTAMFALVCLNVYYRLIIGYVVSPAMDAAA
ncbi:MAG TPA: hypothetical protein VFB92_09710 [Vicinamibacterales bacterium]|nr:hypothetical protein [Vicinamibacterales bacterium]